MSKCFNLACIERDDCDNLKKASCVYEINKVSHDAKMDINKDKICPTCKRKGIKAKKNSKKVLLCIRCEQIKEDGQWKKIR
jgi:ribosomal protein L37AE/L43A